MHLAGSGRVVIQLSKEIGEGTILCDRKGTKVAKVMEVIGPVKRPFASATPLTNNITRYVGDSVFEAASSDDTPMKRDGRRSSNSTTTRKPVTRGTVTTTKRTTTPARTQKNRRRKK